MYWSGLGFIGGGIAGIMMGKSKKEILAMAIGGTVAGGTLGLGSIAVTGSIRKCPIWSQPRLNPLLTELITSNEQD